MTVLAISSSQNPVVTQGVFECLKALQTLENLLEKLKEDTCNSMEV